MLRVSLLWLIAPHVFEDLSKCSHTPANNHEKHKEVNDRLFFIVLNVEVSYNSSDQEQTH